MCHTSFGIPFIAHIIAAIVLFVKAKIGTEEFFPDISEKRDNANQESGRGRGSSAADGMNWSPFFEDLAVDWDLTVKEKNVRAHQDAPGGAPMQPSEIGWNYIMCSSAQLSTTRTPISPGFATRNSAMLVASNLLHSRYCGLRRRSSMNRSGGFPRFFDILSPLLSIPNLNKKFLLNDIFSLRLNYPGPAHDSRGD